METQEPPKIEFPCADYPIKILGESGSVLHALVIEVMETYVDDFDTDCIKVKDSRNGRYQSISVSITATGEPQLRAINDALRSNPVTKMVM